MQMDLYELSWTFCFILDDIEILCSQDKSAAAAFDFF